MSLKSKVEVEGVAAPAGHYSHGIVASGRTLYVAGQVALDEEGQLVGQGDVEAQTRRVLTNLERVITSAGGGLADVVKTSVYLTKWEYRAAVGALRKEFFPNPPPANTLLVVTSLADPEFLVEIDAVVALP